MNTVTPENQKRSSLNKSIRIGGFILAIICIAFACIQAVQFAPQAFNSLASLAQGINSYRDALSNESDAALEITSDTSTAEVGIPLTLSWKKDDRAGTYAFLYSCVDGVTVDIVDTEGLRAIACDTRYSLGDTDTVTIITASEKTAQVDLPYSISFMRPNDSGPIRSTEQKIAITNKSLADSVAIETEVPPQEGAVLGEEAPAKPAPVPVVAYEPVTEYVYQLPISDPKGYTDFATRFLNTGDIVNGAFVARSIEQNGNGAFQFEIKNIGTKTSGTWTYSVTLPDGDVYTSPKQTALKPNERAVITIGFETPQKSSHTFVVVVHGEDTAVANNSFKSRITFVK